jgi:serine/threonine protein kinase
MNLNITTALSALNMRVVNRSDGLEIATISLPLQHDVVEDGSDMYACNQLIPGVDVPAGKDEKRSIVDTSLPTISWENITMGVLLGTGGFSTVHLVTISSKLDSTSAASGEIGQLGLQQLNEDNQYALKRLVEDEFLEGSETDSAAKDIAFEAMILAKLQQHENIIRLHAVSTGFWENPQKGFLVLERLVETLDERIGRWRRTPQCRHEQQLRITQIAPGVARAMEFVHGNKIIYRDLKPQNIGFDVAGTIRLFDFGLARIHEDGGERKLTGCTGSARYMAPEVARSQPYSFPADVHSYGILMWEVCTLQKAYANAVSVSRMLRQVAYNKARPSLGHIDAPAMRDLLAACWNPDPSLRPSFEHIASELKAGADTIAKH